MYWGSLRGFAVVFAEDVPDVSTAVIPPGESKRVFICKIQPKVPFSRFMGGPLPRIHHLCRRQPQHNLEVDSLALPSFYSERFISDSLFLGSAA
jgi:hypothetical protein